MRSSCCCPSRRSTTCPTIPSCRSATWWWTRSCRSARRWSSASACCSRSGSAEREGRIAMLKPPHWEMLIVWYFFLGGIAGGAYFTAAIADLFGEPGDKKVARIGYFIALPLVAVCGALLIADLGVPARFMNMMRVFKFWDPMSIGAWAVGAFGVFAFVSAVLSVPSSPQIDRIRRGVSFVGIFFGFFLAGYTGVLLSSSALPFWSGAG